MHTYSATGLQKECEIGGKVNERVENPVSFKQIDTIESEWDGGTRMAG